MLNFAKKSKTFVTSDTHWHHAPKWENPIWKMRGHSSPKEHDDFIVSEINRRVGKDDDLIHLGDLCLNSKIEDFEQLISSINCQNVYMLWGNHPNPHYKRVYLPLVKILLGNSYVEGMEVYPLQYKNVIYLGHYAEVILEGQYTVLSHYPIYIWNEMQHGAWMLCGHSHYGCELSRAETMTGKILDVGWDGHKSVWTLEEIRAVMDKKQIAVVDHHRPDASQPPVVVEKG
jgi:calcineurin-like phosphoesterase family protein